MNHCAECRQEVPGHLKMLSGEKIFCSLPCMQMHRIPPLRSEPLTKRERFAMVAMQGLVANNSNWPFDHYATEATGIADALIAQLDKGATDAAGS